MGIRGMPNISATLHKLPQNGIVGLHHHPSVQEQQDQLARIVQQKRENCAAVVQQKREKFVQENSLQKDGDHIYGFTEQVSRV